MTPDFSLLSKSKIMITRDLTYGMDVDVSQLSTINHIPFSELTDEEKKKIEGCEFFVAIVLPHMGYEGNKAILISSNLIPSRFGSKPIPEFFGIYRRYPDSFESALYHIELQSGKK